MTMTRNSKLQVASEFKFLGELGRDFQVRVKQPPEALAEGVPDSESGA